MLFFDGFQVENRDNNERFLGSQYERHVFFFTSEEQFNKLAVIAFL